MTSLLVLYFFAGSLATLLVVVGALLMVWMNTRQNPHVESAPDSVRSLRPVRNSTNVVH